MFSRFRTWWQPRKPQPARRAAFRRLFAKPIDTQPVDPGNP
jgi:hypothetical protein